MNDDLDSHFKKKEVINFDLIHHRCRSDPLKNSEEDHKTIVSEDLQNYPSIDEKKFYRPYSGLKEMIYGSKETLFFSILK